MTMQASMLSWVAGILSHGFFGSVVPRRDDPLRSCPGWVVGAAACSGRRSGEPVLWSKRAFRKFLEGFRETEGGLPGD